MADNEDEPMEVEAVVASSEDEQLDDDDDDNDDDTTNPEEDEEATASVVLEDDEPEARVAVAVDEEDDDHVSEVSSAGLEDGNDEVVATVLPEAENNDDNDPEEEATAAVAEPVVATVEASVKKPAPKKKKAPPKKKAADKKDKTTPTKKKKKKAPGSAGSHKSAATIAEVWPVSPARVDMANEARALLHDNVQELPFVFPDMTQVRSFGQIKLPDSPTVTPTSFCTTAALYPVGFSCDRFEFSPVHGRLVKLRCSILDAARVRQLQKERRGTNFWPHSQGPIFRILWGLGVDEDKWADEAQCPFYPPPPLGGPATKALETHPVEGQRVRVRFERKEYYMGTITAVSKASGKGFKINIRYDDGSVEEDTPFPDADVSLFSPGTSSV